MHLIVEQRVLMQLHLTRLMTDSGAASELDNAGTSLAVPSLLGLQPSLQGSGITGCKSAHMFACRWARYIYCNIAPGVGGSLSMH